MFMFRPDPPAVLTQASPMPVLIHCGFNLAFDCLDYTPMVLAIRVRPEREQDLVEPESLTLFPEVSCTTFIDNFGNRFTRLIAPPGRLSIWNRFVMADSGLPEELPVNAQQHAVPELPAETLLYLVGSRYCDTQKLSALAWSTFGGYSKGWSLVKAILDYTHDRIRFSYPSARDERTAFEANEERIGVCR